MLALGSLLVAGQPAPLTQGVECTFATGDDLVHVTLMTGVEEQRVLGRVEHPVQRQGQLHDSEIRSEVAAGRRHLRDEELPDVLSQFLGLLEGELAQVGG